jgi:hypothetical protein
MDTNAILLCVKRLRVNDTAHHTTSTRHLSGLWSPQKVFCTDGGKEECASLGVNPSTGVSLQNKERMPRGMSTLRREEDGKLEIEWLERRRQA